MGFLLTSGDYVDYIGRTARRIAENGDYISGLDAATGDGDHWANMNLGFENLVAVGDELRAMPIDAAFRKIGMLMMSKIGGSSGILYGGGYMAASKACAGKAALDAAGLCDALEAMVKDMMNRGQAEPGMKTMIDALYPAVQRFRQGLQDGEDERAMLNAVKQAALDGAEATRDMAAVKGRASYQTNRGVGHLDPGAVTMSWQSEGLCDLLIEKTGE